MKCSVTRHGISFLLAALFLALILYPVATGSAQDSGVKSAWERVQEAGSYRFLSTIDQTLIPRAVPEMIGQQDQRLSMTMDGAAQLPDQAYIEMWVESGATHAPPVVLIRDGNQDFMQLDGEIKPVENPFGAILPSGDWLGYLVAAKNVQIIEPEPGDADNQIRFRFEVDGPRLAEYVQVQAEAALRQEPGAPAGLSVSPSPLLKRLTGHGELWVGADGLPTRQVLDLNLPQASDAYDAQLHIVVGMSDYGQVENLPRAVPSEDGSWQLQTIAPTHPPASSIPIAVSPASWTLQVSSSDMLIFWLCLIVASILILYRRNPRPIYALITVATVIILIVSPLLESAQVVAFFERRALAAATQEDSARDLAEALGLELNTDQPLEADVYDTVEVSDSRTSELQFVAPSSSVVNQIDSHTVASPEQNDTGLIETCGQGDSEVDSDQDGLSDFDEGCYGTDPYDLDTDSDTITDTWEIQEFEWSGDPKYKKSNPLKADSNSDGLPDGVEWPAPIGEAPGWDPDGDGIPNIWDDDNDGDGVPDGTDLSPFSVGSLSSDENPLSIIIRDHERQGYQYIEFQLQPENTDHMRYTTTWLDWPDNDTDGQITSQVSGTRDVRLIPFLDVTTNAVPSSELCTKYGLVLMQETGKEDHLLIPLFPQSKNGAVNSFYGKVVYGPKSQPSNTQSQINWTDARLVWLVQNVDQNGERGVIHRYMEPFRLTGMQVVISDGYEMGLFGTPDSPLEDKSLFELLFGMSATFLEYAELEPQSAPTALTEIADRFNSNLSSTWHITERVESSVKTYNHQDQALAESGAQVEKFLYQNFAGDEKFCMDSSEQPFECAGIVIGTEERLRAIPVENLNSFVVTLDMTGIEVFTSRSLRYQMYQLTSLNWEAVSLARTLEVMEARYGDQWGTSLAAYRSEYPYLIAEDLRFATYLTYQTWTAGRQSLVSIGEYKILEQSPEDESEVVNAIVGSLKEVKGFTFDLFLVSTELHEEINTLREQRLNWLGEEILFEDALNKLPVEKLNLDQEINKKVSRLKKFAVTSTSISTAALASDIAREFCTTGDTCHEGVLKGFVGVTSFASMALDGYELISDIKKAFKLKSVKAPWSSMSKVAKAAAIVGLVVDVALIWTQFFLTKGDKDSGFQFDKALGTAIVGMIFAIVTFVLMMIPVVNIVAGVITLLLGVVDLLLYLFGSNFSVTESILSFFFRSEMVTKIEEGSVKYRGSSSSLLYEDMGLIQGNTFIITDIFTATIVGSKQLDKSHAWAEWSGTKSDAVNFEEMNRDTEVFTRTSKHKEVTNDVGVYFYLKEPHPNVPIEVNTNIIYELRYKNCVFWGICWYKTDTQNNKDTFDIKLDVLPDSIEGFWSWDDINNPDLDGDGLTNKNEDETDQDDWDSDNDALGDQFEVENQFELGTDPKEKDSDEDDLEDGPEISLGTSPGNPDSDGDGLSDGEEVDGWEVNLPSGRIYTVYSDPLVKDSDGDGLTDRMEKENQTSPYAPNVVPSFLVEGQPFKVAPYGKPGNYVEPDTPLTFNLSLLNTAEMGITSTLQISLTNPYLTDLEVTASGVTSGTVPPAKPCNEENDYTCYEWDFGADMEDGAGPYILPVSEVFTTTLTAVSQVFTPTLIADAADSPGTEGITYAFSYKDLTISDQLDVMVVVDEDKPTAVLAAPEPTEILTGNYYVVGGSAMDKTTWVEDIDLRVDQDPGEDTDFGQWVSVQHNLGSWAYKWTLPREDGHYTLAIRARDAFGNKSDETQVEVIVDNTPPEVSFSPELAQVPIGPQDGRPELTGEASDNLTSLEWVQVSVDDGPWKDAELTQVADTQEEDPNADSLRQNAIWEWSYTWVLIGEAQGRHSAKVRALDKAGNMSKEEQVEFVLDEQPPTDDLLIPLDEGIPILKADPSVTLKGYANDAGNLPQPPQPTALQGEIDALADATVWLSPASAKDVIAGVELNWAGDLDGDRRADLVLGFPASTDGAGKVVVLYGHDGDWELPPDAESLAKEMTSFIGAPGAGMGSQLAAVGDVNGDGLDDLLVGDQEYQRAYLIYGRPSPMGREQKLDGSEPRSVKYTLINLSEDLPLADFVASAGDANGDGYADLFIGAADYAYLILGHHDLPLQVRLDAKEAAAAVITLPEGGSATGLGDVDGDQRGDWAVTNPGSNSLYLLSGWKEFGAQSKRNINPEDPEADRLLLAILESDGFGNAGVAALGDVNADGLADFIYGSGEAPRLVLGRKSGEWKYDEISGYTPAPDGFLAAPGDVDADGKNDLLLGTSDESAYLILGESLTSIGESLPSIKATIMGVVGAASSPIMATADLNCDRSADLLLLPVDQPFGSFQDIEQEVSAVSLTEQEEETPSTAEDFGRSTMTSNEFLYVDDDYCSECANDGLIWQVNAFGNIQDGLDAAGDLVSSPRKVLNGLVTVLVGQGVYTEHLTLPSHVRLVGINADGVRVEGGNAGDVITVEDVVDVEISGLHITHTGGQPNMGIQVAGARDVRITRNLIEGNERGITFERDATGMVAFNTIVDNNDSGLSVTGSRSWANARNNILAGNGVGLVAENSGQVFSGYNLLSNTNNSQGVKSGDGDIQDDPLFAGGFSMPYHLQAGSLAVDAADPEESPPSGGGSRADIGYYELQTVPLTLLFGQQGTSCAEGSSGIDEVEVALVPVIDTSLPITETLPMASQWQTATLVTEGKVDAYWSATIEPQQDGLHRVYTLATDVAGNKVFYYPKDRWYRGTILVDGTPPTVSWISSVEDPTVSGITLLLQATATDWLEMETEERFSVEEVHFEVNGTIYPAVWSQDGWIAQDKQSRTFEALVPLQEGTNEITAVATDLTGHEGLSDTLVVTSTISGNATAITSIPDGGVTNQSELEISGYARFTGCSGKQRSVFVEVDGEEAARVDLDTDFSEWSATVDLGQEGQHTLSAYATCESSADTTEITTVSEIDIWFDQTAPVLNISYPSESTLITTTITLTGTVSDAISGIGGLEVSLDGGFNWDTVDWIENLWSYTWDASRAESGITYQARVRAVDRAANETTQTCSFVVDNQPPGGIEPIQFNHPISSNLAEGTELQASWEPAFDVSGQVSVRATIYQAAVTMPECDINALGDAATIKQYVETLPMRDVDGEKYAVTLDTGGEWCFLLKAQDSAGNNFIYHEGPWYVDTFESGQMIKIDGYLDIPNREWDDKTELLDDDERALAGIVPVQFKAERQFLYTTWDSSALYLGWRGAWWEMHGTMWAFVDTSAGGNKLPPLDDLPELPFGADYAIQVSGSDEGTLWTFTGSEWLPSEQELDFAQGSSGDTEVRLPLDLSSQDSYLSLAVLAVDEEGTTWSTFPTTNPIGQLLDAYHWSGYLGDIRPNSGQPVGSTLVMVVNSTQPSEGFWSSESAIPYSIEVKNWERREVADLQLAFEPGEGFIPMPVLALPAVATEASQTVEVINQLVADLESMTEVVNTISLQRGGIEFDQAILRHPVDGLPPAVQINVPPDNMIGTGLQLVSGTADDGDGSGVVKVEVLTSNEPANGASWWNAQVDIPIDVTSHTFEIRATDAVGNQSTRSHTFHVDSNPPVITFSLPQLLTGDDYALFGTTSDGESRVVKMDVQVDDGGPWLPAEVFPRSEDGDVQSWLFLLDFRREDYIEHKLRARAIDVAGNETLSSWQVIMIDTVAPVITATDMPAVVLLSDYDTGNPTRDPEPVVSGTVSDGGGLSAVVARIEMPDGTEVTAPAVLEGTAFSITPIFERPIAGEYTYYIEATDNAGNQTIHGPFAFIARNIVAPSILDDDQDLTRIEIINKTNQSLSIILSDEKVNYGLKLEAGVKRVFTVPRANYNRITYACGASDTGFLNLTRQVRLVFTPCGVPVPNMGEPSMEKIYIPEVPKGKHWRYK